MSITETLESVWDQILQITSLFVIPDWGALIQLMPVFIFLGVVGPLITFLVLGILGYQIAKPRTKVEFVEGPRTAELDADGQPIFPPGLPHCRAHELIFPSGTTLCDRDGTQLTVVCPMCGLGRLAVVDTCTNCGLVLKVKSRAVAVRPSSGPKPGGAAAA